MKYSIRGNLNIADETEVTTLLNTYNLWRLHTTGQIAIDNSKNMFALEVWLNNVEDKNSLFNALKPFVKNNDEQIDWHECTHDEEISKPCVIAETYRGE